MYALIRLPDVMDGTRETATWSKRCCCCCKDRMLGDGRGGGALPLNHVSALLLLFEHVQMHAPQVILISTLTCVLKAVHRRAHLDTRPASFLLQRRVEDNALELARRGGADHLGE